MPESLFFACLLILFVAALTTTGAILLIHWSLRIMDYLDRRY